MILPAGADPWEAAMQGSAAALEREKHRPGRGGLGAPSSPSSSSRFWTSALVALACCAGALQVQFFRSAHRAATATTSADSTRRSVLRHDVIRFDPPDDFPADQNTPLLVPVSPRPSNVSGGGAGETESTGINSLHAVDLTLSLHAQQLLSQYDPAAQVSPLWNCSISGKAKKELEEDGTGAKKFVFVHVYKTAGSSMRDFLRWYGRTCRRSVSIVYSCSGISSGTLNDTVWRNSHSRRPCKLAYGATSDGREFGDGSFGRPLYESSDLVGGHMPLGVHQNPRHRVQHLTFVRDPLDKYVSGKLYSNRRRNWTAEDAIKRISYEISHLARKGGRYEKYSSYLLTPAQKAEKLDEQEKVRAMQSNLASMNVVVGVVERMDASYRLLQMVLDGSGALDRAFRLLRENKLVRNKSALSTSDLVRRLKARDPDFERQARLVLQAEYMVYDFAVKLHEMQHDRLIGGQAEER